MKTLSRTLPFVLASTALVTVLLITKEDGEDASESSQVVEQKVLTAPASQAATQSEEAAEITRSAPAAVTQNSFAGDLVAALERGAPLTIRVGDADPTQFVMRPYNVTADDFDVSLGAVPSEESTFEQEHYVFQGRSTGSTLIPSRAVLTVVNGAVAAMVTNPDGSVLQVKTDGETGELLALEIDSVDAVCAPSADGSAFEMEAATHSEADWEAGPDIDIYAVGGDDPATGNVPEAGLTIPWGPQYDLSLADAMLLMVLDKEIVGSDSNSNIAALTAEYLAIMTNAATIYEYELGIRLRVQEIVMIPDTSAYTAVTEINQPDGTPTTANNSLTAFGGWLSSNRSQGSRDWTLAALWDDFQSGNTVGLAFVGTVGGSFGRGTNDRGTSWSVVTHEMGHNFGAGHTPGSNGVMAGILSRRNSFTRSFYQAEADNGIVNAKTIYDSSRGDLPDGPPLRDPLEIPFAIDDTVDTPVNTAVTLSPLDNDLANPLQGTPNNTITLVEVGNVSPPNAGSVSISGDQLTFTPASGFRGTALFGYTIAGDLGWLHKADVAVDVGSGTATPNASLPLANDDILFESDPVTGVYRFNPLNNDEGEGFRHLRNIEPHIGRGSGNTENVPNNAFFITNAVNLTPSKGTLTTETRRFTSGGITSNTSTGFFQFAPAAGASGIAEVEYTIVDASGGTDTGLVRIVLSALSINSPSGLVVVPPGQGVVVTGETVTLSSDVPQITSTLWSGDGVVFNDPQSLTSRATFSGPGVYTLRLTGTSDDGEEIAETVVIVSDAPSSTDSLEALYTLDEASGGTANDSSPGGGNDGTLVGQRRWDPDGGVIAGALEFDGSNDYVLIDEISGFTNGKPGGSIDDYAVAFWFQPTNFASGNFPNNLEMLWDAGDNSNGHSIFLIEDQLVVGNWNNGRANEDFVVVGTVEENTYYHVVYSVSGGSQMNVYLNGVLAASGTGVPYPNVNDVGGIGALNGGGRFLENTGGGSFTFTTTGNGRLDFDGFVDQVAVYSRSIPAAEAAFLASRNQNAAPEITFAENPLVVASTAETTSLTATTDNDLGTTLWESISGPGVASIATPASTTTTATFDTAGSYTLHFNATTPDVTTFRALVVNVTTQASEDTFENYLDEFSLSGADRLPDADPDSDGVSNLTEFAFGGDPTTADSTSIAPVSTFGGGALNITYRQRNDSEGAGTVGVDYTVAGIEYAVEVGSNLTYEVIPSAVEQVGDAIDNGDGTESVTVRVTPPNPNRGFSRVRVSEVE